MFALRILTVLLSHIQHLFFPGIIVQFAVCVCVGILYLFHILFVSMFVYVTFTQVRRRFNISMCWYSAQLSNKCQRHHKCYKFKKKEKKTTKLFCLFSFPRRLNGNWCVCFFMHFLYLYTNIIFCCCFPCSLFIR